MSVANVPDSEQSLVGAKSPYWRRTLLAALSSLYVRRRCKTPDGEFEAYVSPGSSLKVLRPGGLQIDPVHSRFVREWIAPDAVVWDVGANMGLFALPAALKAKQGRVYAFEPDVDLTAHLLRTLRLDGNKALNVLPLCIALSSAEGAANFQISKFGRSMNKLETAAPWNQALVTVRELRSVATMRIDTLAQSLSPPTVFKIDVEGAEMEVLKGGEGTIAKYRPTMLVEGPRELSQPMKSFFEKHDYLMLDGAAVNQIPLNEPVWDTVAVPKERFAARKQRAP